jgi:C-terminal processing protease CtpA/Prc
MKPHVVCLLGLLTLLGTSCQQTASTDKSGLFNGSINAVFEGNPSIVLIVPTGESNASDQERILAHVNGIERMITERGVSSNTEIITDSEALERDLGSNSVLVYGTVHGNRWLAQHINEIPVAIEPNSIMSDREYEGANLRFITAWPNPDNPSRGVLIYTAQRAQDVVGINSVTHGMTDYVIAQGKTIIGAGSYIKSKGQWSIRPPLDLDDAIEDTNFFFRTVEQVHPNHLANISRADYNTLKQQCRTAFEGEYQQKGRISKASLALALADVAAAFGDGHTSLWLNSDLIESERSVLMPPFRLKWQAGHILIHNTTKEFEYIKTARLLRINGVDIEVFLQPMLAKISGEREAHRISRFLSKQQIYWALLQPVKEQQMEITIARGLAESETLVINLIDLPLYRKTFKEEDDLRPAGTHFFYHNDRICYWRYNSFNYTKGGRKAIDEVFSKICDKDSQNLIIDLRFNGGGNSQAGDYILNYITSKPYRIYSGSDVKISKQVYEKGLLGVLARLMRGRIYRHSSRLKRPRDMGFRFDGKVYALIGPATFSSASDFAAVLEDFDIATLVGEETGGLRECFGDSPRFTLPNSGLKFTVSHKLFFAPKPRPDDDKRGVVPDIVINDKLLAGYMNADDPVLAFTLNMVEEKDRM